MKLCILHIFILLILSSQCTNIRKCCERGEFLDGLKCIPKPNHFDWIPTDDFIVTSSKSTLKISKDLVNKTVDDIYKSNFAIGFPDCDLTSRDVAIAWKNHEREDEFYLLSDGSGDILLNFHRRSVYHDNVTLSFRKIFSPEDYCVDSALGGTFLAIICPCKKITCIRKCCHEDSVFDQDTNSCVWKEDVEGLNRATYKDWRPNFMNFDSRGDDGTEQHNQYFLLSGSRPPCFHERGLYDDQEFVKNNFTFLADGSVKTNQGPHFILFDEYCGDWGWKKDKGNLEAMFLRCFPKIDDEGNNELNKTYRPSWFLIWKKIITMHY